jgi:hypothetical protein
MDAFKYAVQLRYNASVSFWEKTINEKKLKANAEKLYKAGRCVRKSIIFVIVGGLLGFLGYQQFLTMKEHLGFVVEQAEKDEKADLKRERMSPEDIRA